MTSVPFRQLPDDARLWTFAASRPLDSAEAARLLERVDAHLDGWLAHGRAVHGGREWRYDRFLLVAADERATGVSGCSIDALFRVLGELEQELGVALRDGSRVWFRDADGEIRAASRAEFRGLAREGAIGADTTVFDTTVATVGELRGGRWETPMTHSWHGRAFLPATAPARE